ncbi:MAG TPA: hypothetical protein VGM98_17800 [Schlesneria sp.]|jgi:MFS family permease
MAIVTVTEGPDGLGVQPEDPAEIWIAREEANRRRRRWLLLSAVLVMMSVGYILSPGILVVLTENGWSIPVMHPVMQIVLFPLQWVYDRSELVRSFDAGYFELIGVDE